MSSRNRPIKEIGEVYLTKEGMTFHEVSDTVCSVTEKKAPRNWWIAFFITSSFAALLFLAIGYVFWQGIGVWGNDSPSFWAWDITNFVWWIGIGHAGTLISAVLFIFRQKWRTGINRAAEAMTIFAVICALLFPAIHVGRVWFIYYMFPIPNQMAIWPNFKSPLIWDFFAVSTYFTVSLLFWYSGLIPDFALLRDRAMGMTGRVGKIRRLVYGSLALGWRGSHRHWQNYERMYLILAALATPLVLSVHSVVSMDFATSVIPGWHTTIFPPYFVAGAIFSGFAMVQTLMLITRAVYGMKSLITMRHLELMNKIMLLTGLLVGYAYAMEFFIAAYSGNEYERYDFLSRIMGPFWWAYVFMFGCNCIVPQVFWFKKLRTSVPVMLIASCLINIGMWFERFVIIVQSQNRDFLPSSWGYYRPTGVDVCVFLGTLGLFFTLFLLFIRWVPMIAIAEVKGVMPQADPHDEGEHSTEGSPGHEAAADAALAGGE